MPVNDDLYTALTTALGSTVDGVFDTKFPPRYVLANPAVVFTSISDVPETAIDGAIIRRVARWQVSVWAGDLVSARAVKAAVIAALHGYSGTYIARCEFENCPAEFFEEDAVPPGYHIPIDFMIQH